MFSNRWAASIADEVLWNADVLRQALVEAFENAIVGQGLEVRFFRRLLSQVEDKLNSVSLGGLNVRCRTKETHMKPRVRVQAPRAFQCELADLLVVVKYVSASNAIERKCLFYQVKLCDTGTLNCKINPDQPELLCDWPSFEFGLKADGGPRTHSINPHTLEFGSFMLMQRNPGHGSFVPCRSHFCNIWAYGVSSHALAVRKDGPSFVDISTFPYATNSAEAFFRHLAFEIGEDHDFNQTVHSLVEALYRHLGLDPDPPTEFDGYFRSCGEEEPGFALIEITVSPGEGFGKGIRRPKRLIRSKEGK
jgi:hypothetical protein